MRFEPKTENEIAEVSLIPAGEYPFEVVEAVEATSKAGNEMIKLKLSVHTGDSAQGVFDYLVAGERTIYKVRHFADTVGMIAEYELGDLKAEGLIGLTGMCKIKVDPAKGEYPAKNSVADYIKRSVPAGVVAASAANGKTHTVVDDDIPF